jgi:hypothetical protein
MAVKRWNGTQWVLQAGSSKPYYQASAPTSPVAGDIWIESDIDVPIYDGTYQTGNRNFIINGNFEFWQRGTSQSAPGGYLADRWSSTSGTNHTVSRGTTSPLSGSQYYWSITSIAGVAGGILQQALETANVIKLAGKSVTLSYWVRSTSTISPVTTITYSTTTDALASQTTALTTSTATALVANTWTKETVTFTVPSTALGLRIALSGGISSGVTTDYSQIQLELGTSATPFEHRPYGQELALCQRYYYRISSDATNIYTYFGAGQAISATAAQFSIKNPVTMRTVVSSIDTTGTASNYGVTLANGNIQALTSVPTLALNNRSTDITGLGAAVASGLVAGNFSSLNANNTSTAYIGFSAEL